MHMTRQAALLIAAVAGISFGAAAQQQPPAPGQQQGNGQPQRRKVSLREALQLAARQGPDVAAARAQAAVVHAGVEKAWTAWQPDISASGTFDHTSAPAEIPAGALGPNSKAITIIAPNTRLGT